MKKLLMMAVAALLIVSCNNEKEKAKADDAAAGSTPKQEAGLPATGNDAALTTWLSGKTLIAANPGQAMYDHLKLNADGTCEDKDKAHAKWKIEGGQFVFQGAMDVKNRIEKRNDTTVVFKGSIGEDVYTVSPSK